MPASADYVPSLLDNTIRQNVGKVAGSLKDTLGTDLGRILDEGLPVYKAGPRT